MGNTLASDISTSIPQDPLEFIELAPLCPMGFALAAVSLYEKHLRAMSADYATRIFSVAREAFTYYAYAVLQLVSICQLYFGLPNSLHNIVGIPDFSLFHHYRFVPCEMSRKGNDNWEVCWTCGRRGHQSWQCRNGLNGGQNKGKDGGKQGQQNKGKGAKNDGLRQQDNGRNDSRKKEKVMQRKMSLRRASNQIIRSEDGSGVKRRIFIVMVDQHPTGDYRTNRKCFIAR